MLPPLGNDVLIFVLMIQHRKCFNSAISHRNTVSARPAAEWKGGFSSTSTYWHFIHRHFFLYNFGTFSVTETPERLWTAGCCYSKVCLSLVGMKIDLVYANEMKLPLVKSDRHQWGVFNDKSPENILIWTQPAVPHIRSRKSFSERVNGSDNGSFITAA